MSSSDIPVIDLGGKDEPAVARQIDSACRDVGFFYVKNHGIETGEVDAIFDLTRETFDDAKRVDYPIDETNHGYSGLRVENLDPSTSKVGDYKEAFNYAKFGKEAGPPFSQGAQERLSTFERACHALCSKILTAFASALSLPHDKFLQAHDHQKPSGTILRLLHYPAVPKEIQRDEEEMMAGAHSDYGSLTLLFQHGIGGLQVKLASGQWIDAPVLDDAVLVNVGDALEFWTSGVYKSTLHRVVPNASNRGRSRYSIAYFKHPNDDVLLEPLSGDLSQAQKDKVGGETKPLTAKEHLHRRLAASYPAREEKKEVNGKRSIHDVLKSNRPARNEGAKEAGVPGVKRRRQPPASHFDPKSEFQSVDMSKFEALALGLEDADCFYDPNFMTMKESKALYGDFLKLDSWYQPMLKMYGREFKQSRQIAAYAEKGLELKYSGQKVDMSYEWPECLRRVQRRLEEHLGVKFNHVMLNRYDDGSVHIGSHADNLENKVIASLSLGGERTFILKHRTLAPDQGGLKKFRLRSGSLLVMQGPMQQYWKHEIPKELRQKEGRISLTFRQLLY